MNNLVKYNPNSKLTHWKSYTISSVDRAYMIFKKPSAFIIFEWLCFHCTPNTNRIQVQNQIIAEALGMAIPTISKSIKFLTENKLIRENEAKFGGKFWEINVYFISKGQEFWSEGVWYEAVEIAPEDYRKNYLMDGVAVVNTYNVIEKI